MQKNADTNADPVQGLDWLDNEQKVHEKMHARLPHRLPGARVLDRLPHTGRPVTRPHPGIGHDNHHRLARPDGRPSRPVSTGLA